MQSRRLLSLLICAVLFAPAAAQEKPKGYSTTEPVPRDAGWLKRHETFVGIAKRGGVELLFVGDSITDAWGGEGHNPKAAGAKIFEKEFLPLKAANFGIGGDRTQHVLWRLQNGELDGIQPRVLMLMIGTNNVSTNTAEEIAAGVTAIVKEIHKRSPKTKVLLLGVFPRADNKSGMFIPAQMDKIKAINTTIAKLDDGGKTVRYLDIGSKFLASDGSLPREVMPDMLHLSEKGYQIWADAVKGPIMEMLGKR
jgi:lysophospholipase L1-like esterase